MSEPLPEPRFMLLRRTWAIARKELRHITRSRLTLLLVTVSPALLLFLLAYVFAFNVDQADMVAMDLSRSRASRMYLDSLTAGGSLTLIALVDSYEAIDRHLVAGSADVGLVIPPDFDPSASAPVQLIVDGSNPIIARQIIGIVQGASRSAGMSLASERSPELPFEVRSRVWYNDDLNSQVGMVPGLMAIVLCLPALALSLSLTREKELGTLEGLMATPMEGLAYLAGKTSAYVLTGLIGLLLSWLVAVFWFKVPFRGQMGLLILLTLAYFLATSGVSLLIASRTSSQQTAILLVMLVFFVPSFFLAGLIDPIDRQSASAVLLSLPLPATHFIAITRGLFLKGAGFKNLAQPFLLLLAMGIIALLVSTATFKKRLS